MSSSINLTFKSVQRERPECSICYQPINKMAISCSNPCNKLFHASCLEKIFEQEEEAQAEDVDLTTQFIPTHQCCYCRRYINIKSYTLKKFVHELIALKNSRCFHVDEALQQVLHNLNIELKCSPEKKEEFLYTFYEIYELELYTTKIKMPKQSKHAEYKRTRMPRQNLMVHRNNHGKR